MGNNLICSYAQTNDVASTQVGESSVVDFDNRKSEFKQPPCGNFYNFEWEEISDQLKLRLRLPEKINQASTNLCGIACCMYLLAKNKKATYKALVQSLYEKAEYTHPVSRFKITACNNTGGGSDLTTIKPIDTDFVSSGLEAIDFITLASARDSLNKIFDYTLSGKLSAITLPTDIIKLLKGLNEYSILKDKIDIIGFTDTDKVKDELQYMSERSAKNDKFILLINADCINNLAAISYTPNHWIVFEKYNPMNTSEFSIEYYTWGTLKKTVFTYTTFTKNYYGYIAAH